LKLPPYLYRAECVPWFVCGNFFLISKPQCFYIDLFSFGKIFHLKKIIKKNKKKKKEKRKKGKKKKRKKKSFSSFPPTTLLGHSSYSSSLTILFSHTWQKVKLGVRGYIGDKQCAESRVCRRYQRKLFLPYLSFFLSFFFFFFFFFFFLFF